MNASPPWFVRAARGEKRFWTKPDPGSFELESNADGRDSKAKD